MAFGDGGGEFLFGVVAVADADDGPGVDDRDGVEVGRRRGLAVVVGVGGELGQVFAQAPGPPDEAQGGEGE